MKSPAGRLRVWVPRNDGSEVIEATYVYFNLPHRAQPVPVAGNQTDAVNFFALPPKDCPRAM